MTRLVDMIRDCPNSPPELAHYSDEDLIRALEHPLENGYRIMDMAVDIGCEVAVEEVCYFLGIWERP